jgi:hypothetical protein
MMTSPKGHDADGGPESALTRTALAIGAAWCVPGLGHLLLGRLRRGAIFAVLIWGSFALGLAHDGRLALRDQRQPFLTTLQVVANLGVGPADLVARRIVYGEIAYTMPGPGATARGARSRSDIFRDRARSGLSIYGTAYLWTAGLMNLLLLFDVWDIGRGRKP